MSPLCAPCQVDGRAHLSNEAPFIETLSIRIPSARSNWNNSFRCSFTKERSNTTLTDSPRTANTMNEVFGCLRKVMVNDVCRNPVSAAVRWDCERSPCVIAALIPLRFRFLQSPLCSAEPKICWRGLFRRR